MSQAVSATLFVFLVAFAFQAAAQEKSPPDLQASRVSAPQRHDGCTTLRLPGIAESANQYRSYAIDRCRPMRARAISAEALTAEMGKLYRDFVTAENR